MQKQKKQFMIILILLVVSIAVLLLAKFYNKKQEEKETAETEALAITVTDIDVNTITAFSYLLDGEILSFSYDGENWTYDEDEAVDIDEDSVSSMLSAIASITTTQAIEDYGSLSDYGLEEPANTITITSSEGSISICLGDKNEILNEYYLMTSEADVVYLVGSNLISTFNKTVEDLTVEEVVEETEETEE